MAWTATKLFQGLTQLSLETHLDTDKGKLTLFKQQTKKHRPKKKKGERCGGESRRLGRRHKLSFRASQILQYLSCTAFIDWEKKNLKALLKG